MQLQSSNEDESKQKQQPNFFENSIFQKIFPNMHKFSLKSCFISVLMFWCFVVGAVMEQRNSVLLGKNQIFS